MADGTLEALIPKTQELLQSLIAKPKLADKLLSKPPFRFLHDIVSALQQSTGFPQGLYNAFELDSANIKDKNQKLAYLDKIIVCVGTCLGRDVDVRSAKIVAGLEPENTNLLLQELAKVASDKSIDWSKGIQKTLEAVPSLTPDGGIAISGGGGAPPAAAPALAPTAAPVPAVAAEKPAPSSRPSSKEQGEGERTAPSEAKSEVKRSKAEVEGESASVAAPPPVEKRSSAESKQQPQAASTGDANDPLQQQIRACTGDFEQTKVAVEQVIAKPKMSVKLLSKPPFRFLHDIVSEVTRVTGFADGLYTPEELDSNSIKEKQAKIDYLTKIIACVGCQLNVELEARPAKIVAGLEPEQTCQFLQLLAIACRQGSSATAVQRVLSGDTAVRPAAATTKASSPPPTSAPAPAPKAEPAAAPAAESKSRASTPPDAKPRATKEQPPTAEPEVKPSSRSGPRPTAEDEDSGNLKFPAAQAKEDGDATGEMAPLAVPGTSGGTTSRTSRPTTARRRPPKLKENVTEVGRLMVPDAKTIAVSGLMKDGANLEDVDDDAGDDAAGSNAASSNVSRTSTPPIDDGSVVHGRMLQEILKEEAAARKHKEDEDKAAASNGPTLETETGIRLGRRNKSFKGPTKGAASSMAEVQELRASIQQICQATQPMGKCIEFVHEDLEAMAKELERWRKEYETKCDAYNEERKKTDKELQPLFSKLREVEEEIKEQVHKINSIKATIVKNEDKTQQMLRSVVSA